MFLIDDDDDDDDDDDVSYRNIVLHEETILQPFTAPPLAHRISMLSGMLVVKGRSTSKMTQ